MSSLNTTILTELQAIRAEMLTLKLSVSSLEERISAKPSAEPSVAKPTARSAPKKVKSTDSAPRAPTAWRLFADRVRSVLREAGFEGKSLGTECVQFCSSLKDENADFSSWTESDILARRAAWVKPEVSKQAERGDHWKDGKKLGSAAASVASDADGGAPVASEAEPAKKVRKNPWAGLSDEQRAERVKKMQDAKAAKKAAAASSSDADAEAPASDAESAPAVSVTSSEKKKRGPKKFADMTPEELAEAKAKRAANAAKKEVKTPAEAPSVRADLPALPASPAVSAASVGSLIGFQRVMLSGMPLWVNLTTGHAYNRLSDGGKGDWAGIFHRTPKPHLDDSVAEPELSFTDLDALD